VIKRKRSKLAIEEYNFTDIERRVVLSLAKGVMDRTTADNRLLADFFAEASCFKELDINKNDLYRVVQKMEFKQAVTNEVLFKIGDSGDYFYILIYGKVQLYLPNAEIETTKRALTTCQIQLVQAMRSLEQQEVIAEKVREIKRTI
jgi:hypothetical protein